MYDEPGAGPPFLLMLDSQTLGRHDDRAPVGVDPDCPHCTADGCPERARAEKAVKAWRQERAARLAQPR